MPLRPTAAPLIFYSLEDFIEGLIKTIETLLEVGQERIRQCALNCGEGGKTQVKKYSHHNVN